MNMQDFSKKMHTYIDDNRENLIESLAEIVRQPSVSSTGEGVEQCCDKIIDIMQNIGITTQRCDIKPHPAIIGVLGNDPNKKTVLIYAHYDVQPVGKIELWNTPPFDPVIKDGKMYARGTADNKGPLIAHLNAVKFWINEYGDVPVNLRFVFEGSEESNSAGLKELLMDPEIKELLKSDLTYFSDGSKNHNDTPIIAMGVKGMLYIELVLTTMTRDLHSQYAPVLPSASWQMVELLGKLRKDGIVQVPEFYDDVIPPTALEKSIYQELPDVSEELKSTYNAYPSYPKETGYYAHLNGTPSFNLTGIYSGHTGEGSATVLTSKAVAKIDMRLVLAQDGEKIFNQIKSYIKKLGYDNVEVIKHGVTPASKTPVESPFLPVIERAVIEVFEKSMVYPNRPSTAPDYLWTHIVGSPAIQVRWCDFDSDNHAPNEHLTLNNYLRGIQLTATVLKEISEMK